MCGAIKCDFRECGKEFSSKELLNKHKKMLVIIVVKNVERFIVQSRPWHDMLLFIVENILPVTFALKHFLPNLT